jgi:protein tyrosine phosphatase
METQLSRDISKEYILRYEPLQFCELSIPYKQFLHHSRARDHTLEFKILKKITETKTHAQVLVENIGDYLSQNRYPDILPFKDTMITPINSSYMNSNQINGFNVNSGGMFIASQAPIELTLNSFWQLIWDYNVPLIIMGCNLVEDNIEKCFQYFPPDDRIRTEDFEIFMVKQKTQFPNLIERVLLVTHPISESQKMVHHLHFTAWPDALVPSLNDEFYSISYMLGKIEKKWKGGRGKILVHCSAGVGRTGVIIAIYNLVSEIKEQGTLSVFKTVRLLREQRWGMVATEEQYDFIYQFMEYWISSYLIQSNN